MRRAVILAGMVTVLVAVLFVINASRPGAQGRPVLSPRDSASGTVGDARLSITYGRPSMRGRKIFGSLVPFDRVWCPGADECTTLTTNHDLQFTGFKLPAGEYSLWMLPGEASWTLIFNGVPREFHTMHDSRRDLGKVVLEKHALTMPVEQLTFTIEPDSSSGGSRGAIAMSWETTRVVAPFTVAR